MSVDKRLKEVELFLREANQIFKDDTRWLELVDKYQKSPLPTVRCANCKALSSSVRMHPLSGAKLCHLCCIMYDAQPEN